MKQYVVFGDFATNRVGDGNWKGLAQLYDDCPNTLGKREFKTEEERMAYIQGLNDAVGWMECWPLSKEELKKMSRYIRLTDIPNLSD